MEPIPDAPAPRFAIIILNWNGGADTQACIDSIQRLTPSPTWLIVADNGSSDGSLEILRSRHSEIILIENGTNLGFSGGNNAGIRLALELGADWILLINNDTVAPENLLTKFHEATCNHPHAGILGATVLFQEPSDTIWFAGQNAGLLTGYSGRPRGYGKRFTTEFEADLLTDRVVGACMAVSRDVCETVGLLDEKLFAYVEDLDWCLRARAAGFEVWQLGGATISHHVSASGGGESVSPYPLYYGARNTIVVFERHRHLPRLFTLMRRGVVLTSFSLHAVLRGNRRAGLKAVIEGWRDARAGVLGMWTPSD